MQSEQNEKQTAAATPPEKTKIPLKQRVKERLKKTSHVPIEQVERFYPAPSQGLSKKQVEERQKQGLVNKVTKKYSKSYKSIFIGNICTVFNLLCLVAAIALIFARASMSQFLFVAIFSANIFIGIFLEIRAKLKIDKLTILSSPSACVIRDGHKEDIPVEALVVDDIILLSAGQQVTADCIAVDGVAELNESLLTGESVPIKKEDGDFIYAGSFVASGKVAARVDKIGDDTYVSKLTSKAKSYKRPNSEIMNSITLFIKIIAIVIIVIAILMFPNNLTAQGGSFVELAGDGGFWKALVHGNKKVAEALKFTASVIIGMIPSGLLLLTTVALSKGMIHLAKYNTLVQDMYSLEMLARVNVLCLDKTGTITDGRMRVSDCILLNNNSEFSIDEILGSMLASLNDNNQTSIALYERFGHSSALQPIATLPFSSARKLSAVTFDGAGTYVMGAPEFVLKPMPMRIDKIVKQYAQMGLRVLVLAQASGPIQGDTLPPGLRAVAILTLSDNIRPDAIETIQWFKDNDVAVKVISGDNPVTVSEVARRAGITNAAQFISLEGLSDLEVETAANQYTVFGRVTPEQKAILIRAMKRAGNTVAMTGDGVNDILAMKDADCAISVASGSDAARNVSNLVLQDNNFSSMPRIVNEGRRVINNVKDSAALYITKTLLILTLAVVCICLGSSYFFTTSNMLIYEMVISAIPSTVLALFQPNTKRVHGKFIPFVLSRAIPGALTMAMSILIIHCLSTSSLAGAFGLIENGGYTYEYHALLVMALTFGGLVILYRICQPFNLFKGLLFVLATVLCVLVFALPGVTTIVFEDWAKVSFSLSQWLLLILTVQICFPVSGALIKVFDMMNPADENE